MSNLGKKRKDLWPVRILFFQGGKGKRERSAMDCKKKRGKCLESPVLLREEGGKRKKKKKKKKKEPPDPKKKKEGGKNWSFFLRFIPTRQEGKEKGGEMGRSGGLKREKKGEEERPLPFHH